MEKICLDYHTALDFLRGDATVVEKLNYYADREEICISSLTLTRLLFTVKRHEVVASFANSVTILPIDHKTAVVSSKIKKHMDEHKKELPHEILLTAAVCIANNAFLYTKKPTDFEGIKGLRKV